MLRRVALAAVLTCAVVAAAAPSALARAKYDVRLLAKVPSPGQPALSLVAPDRTIYVGTFTNSSGSPNGPSKVFAYTPAGKLKRTYTIKGQDPGANNGVQVAAIDAQGLLYLLDQHPARVVTLNPRTGAQSTYATFKDVPTCPPPGVGNECSATLLDNPPEPDYAAWGTARALFVTDYTQGLIWRVPPGGGAAHVWFTDSRLDGVQFGPAGIVNMPPRHNKLMISTSAGGPTSPNPTSGKLYTLLITNDGTPGELEQIYESGVKEAPDGFGIAKSGNVYLALVGPGTNQLVVVAPDGHQIARISHAASGPNDVPFDEPSSVVFDGKRAIVTNDAFFSGNPDHFAIFDVYAGEPGAPVYIPPPLGGPAAKRAHGSVRPRRVRAGRRVRLRLRVTRAGRGVRGARARVKGRRSRKTGRGGRTRLRVTFHRAGLRTVRFTKGGRTIARVHVRVLRRR